jgi:hypothetical protein
MGYVTIFQDFKIIEKFMLWLVVVFLAYVVAGILAHPNWGTVLVSTVVPPIKPDVTYFTGAVGLLGTTITPYLFFWQTAAEREERRGVAQLGETYIDISSGMVFSNVIAYFIVVSTASTLFIHHQSVNTAADAARALEPFAGHFATIIFSIGILGPVSWPYRCCRSRRDTLWPAPSAGGWDWDARRIAPRVSTRSSPCRCWQGGTCRQWLQPHQSAVLLAGARRPHCAGHSHSDGDPGEQTTADGRLPSRPMGAAGWMGRGAGDDGCGRGAGI